MKDGLDTKCKDCRKTDYYALQDHYKAACKQYYQEHKEYFAVHNKTYWAEHKEERMAEFSIWSSKVKTETLSHYSNGTPLCACCGENILLLLTVDHINGGGAAHRRAGSGGGVNFYSKLRKQGYPPGYQVLCFTCNTGKHLNGGICPHSS